MSQDPDLVELVRNSREPRSRWLSDTVIFQWKFPTPDGVHWSKFGAQKHFLNLPNLMRQLAVFSYCVAETYFSEDSHVRIITWGSMGSRALNFDFFSWKDRCRSRLLEFRNIRSSSLDPGHRWKFHFREKMNRNIFDRFQLIMAYDTNGRTRYDHGEN